MANIKDVARSAGVGIATASRALNGTGYVAPETRKRIEEAAQKLHYSPSVLARNLLRSRSGIIAVMVPTLSNPFFASFTQDCEQLLLRHGYKTLICCTVQPQNSEQDYLDMLRSNLVDGILTATHSFNDDAYRESGNPIVSLDRNLGGNIPLVSSDHCRGGLLAAEHFAFAGCRMVLQICGSDVQNGHLTVGEAHRSCREALLASGVKSEILFTDWNRWDFTYYRRTAAHCLDAYPEADGILASDCLAMHVLTEALQRGKSIPDELKIIAYDGTDTARLASPALSCIVQDTAQLARTAVDTLLARIQNVPIPEPPVCNVSWLQGTTCP